MRARVRLMAVAVLSAPAAAAAAADNPFVPVPEARFHSALPLGNEDGVTVPGFLLQRHPVTNAEYLAFVAGHPQWQKGSVPATLADADYLGHWMGPLDPGPGAAPAQPVTRVSWFAAEAYCEAESARLPTWYEWELAAAASATRRDARADPGWRQQMLDWYAHPAGDRLPAVEQGTADVYGLYDIHGLVWEWVHDFDSLLPADADPERFCGSGAQNLQQKENYPVLMRIALLGSLRAADTGHGVGFRCARDAAAKP